MSEEKYLIKPTNEQIAHKAVEYSRAFIKKSCTRISNNENYSNRQQKDIEKAIKDVRKKAAEKDGFQLEINEAIQKYVATIEVTKKHSIGNCKEYAFMALDYMAHDHPEVNAEVFFIHNGDHNFLVIGRDPKSNPKNPAAWGEHCYICDPWSEVPVYPAAQYQENLKNFYSVTKNGRHFNKIEDFDEKRHKLKSLCHRNTKYLLKFNDHSHIQALIDQYQKRTQAVKQALDGFKAKLDLIQNRLSIQCGDKKEEDARYKAISDKINKITCRIQLVDDILSNSLTSQKDHYVKTYQELKGDLANIMDNFFKALSMSGHDVLLRHTDDSSFKNQCMRFFNIPTKTTQELKSACHAAMKDIKKMT